MVVRQAYKAKKRGYPGEGLPRSMLHLCNWWARLGVEPNDLRIKSPLLYTELRAQSDSNPLQISRKRAGNP